MSIRKFAAAAAVALMSAGYATAAPITVNPGENHFFNFDLTGLPPGPNFSSIRIQLNPTGLDGNEIAHWNVYGDWGPPPGAFIGAFDETLSQVDLALPGVDDGIFSIQLVVMGDSSSGLTVDPYVIRVTKDRQEYAVAVPPNSVPVPGTLALAGLALACLAARQSRRST